MRAAATREGIRVKAYAGTTGVLLAMDLERPELRDGLLGFAVRRRGGNRPEQFLSGTAHFAGQAPERPGAPVPTNAGPVQRFRWSDYRVFPDTEYTYTIFGVHGDPQRSELREGPTVTVRTSSAASGAHRVLFNRAAAASQAFSREFPEVERALDARKKGDPPFELPPKAKAWLSRGLLEQITGFIARAADATWALDIAIYEYELAVILEAVRAARARGAHVRVVYHAKPGDEQTEVNERNLADLPAECKRARVTRHICHHKFIVLSRLGADGAPAPQAVLCGSTNFTENGVYRQANVSHIAERDDVARRYAALFEQLFTEGLTPAQTAGWIGEHDALAPDGPLVVGFSPRHGRVDLELFRDEIAAAHRDVLFCTAFDLDRTVLDALLGAAHDDVLRLGVQNSRSTITGYHRDRTADFTATALLNRGLEGFLKESTAGQKGNILIHTKLIVLNFTSAAPTVISGSHNFSDNASSGNDENFLILRGSTDVADCYGVELLRIYDHYRARFNAKRPKQDGARVKPHPCGDLKPGELCPDDRWTAPYFAAGSLECVDRVRFAGGDA